MMNGRSIVDLFDKGLDHDWHSYCCIHVVVQAALAASEAWRAEIAPFPVSVAERAKAAIRDNPIGVHPHNAPIAFAVAHLHVVYLVGDCLIVFEIGPITDLVVSCRAWIWLILASRRDFHIPHCG